MDTLNSATALLNHWGPAFCDFAGAMLVQSSILIGLLLIADLCLRRRVGARFRYGMWLLVLVKLALPPSLALPTGAAWWLRGHPPAVSLPATPAVFPASPASVERFRDIAAAPAGVVQAATGREALSLRWPGQVLLAWTAGVVLLLAFVLRQLAAARGSLHRSRPAGKQMADLMEECRANLGITTQVDPRLTDEMGSPAVCGFVRPVILLPATLPSRLRPDGLRTILTHELVHIRRCDPWVSLGQTVLQVAYFWHPLVWVANVALRRLRESAVDETVLATLRSQAQCYTDTLIDIARMAFRKPAFSLRLIGIAESKRALERRITHMLNRRISRRPALGLSGLLAIVVIGAVLLPMGRANTRVGAEPNAVQAAPALPEGIAELLELDKDHILAKFGKPQRIFWEDKTYTLENLPERYNLAYEDISFLLYRGAVGEITLQTDRHVFGNGICVGSPEDKVKQAFGPEPRREEDESKDYLIYGRSGSPSRSTSRAGP
jgi:beta-lactamase regulating signal transducer with metallopeptidase domain